MDVLIKLLQVEMVFSKASQHSLRQRRDGLGRQTLKVIVFEVT